MNRNNNVVFFCISLVVSLLIWLQIKLNNIQTSSVTVPVRYNNHLSVPVSGMKPQTVTLHLSGPGLALLRVYLTKPVCFLQNVIPDDEKQILDPDDIKLDLPNNISIIDAQIGPSKTNSMSDKTVQQTLPIQLDFANPMAEKYYHIQNYYISSNEITLKGNPEYLGNIKAVKTKPITKSMLNKNKIKIKLDIDKEYVGFRGEQLYLIKNTEQLITRVFTEVPIKMESDLTFFPSSITVRISGTADRIATLKSEDIEVIPDRKKQSRTSIPLKVSLPPGFTILGYSPSTVQIIK